MESLLPPAQYFASMISLQHSHAREVSLSFALEPPGIAPGTK